LASHRQKIDVPEGHLRGLSFSRETTYIVDRTAVEVDPEPPPLSTARPVAIVTAGMLLQMVLQVGLQAILSRRLGADRTVDAFEAATSLPLVLASMVTLPLGAVLIPIVTRARSKGGGPAAIEAASTFAIVVAVGTCLVAALLCWFRRESLTALYNLTSDELQIAMQVLSIAAWLIPGNAAIALGQGFHYSRNRFALPAFAGVLGPAVTLALLAFSPNVTVQTVVRALLIGAATNAAIVLVPLAPRFRPAISTGVLRAAGALVGPVLLGTIYWRIDPLIDRSIGSGFDEGTVASLGYCTRITNALAALASGGLSVVAFPRMSHAAGRSGDALARETSSAIGSSLLILIPLATAWFTFGDEIIRDLFEGGRFTAADTSRVAGFVRCAMGVVIGGSLGEILARTFYAQHNTLTPTLIGVGCMTVGFGLKWLFSRYWGPGGVLVASSLAICASTVLQFVVLRRRLGPAVHIPVARDGLAAVCATLAAGLCGWAVLRTGMRFGALAGGSFGLAVYVTSLYL
jgi:putative peptidoglycan lipid II flippase